METVGNTVSVDEVAWKKEREDGAPIETNGELGAGLRGGDAEG